MAKLDNFKVAALATTGFEQVEFTSPRDALQEAGATVHLIAPQSDSFRAWDGDDWGDTFTPDQTLARVNASDYDALLLPGGVLNPDTLRVNADAVAFVRTFFDEEKPVAAICHGPWTLIEAEVVEGRRLTSYKSIRTDLVNAGADWVSDEAVVDGTLLTSRNPDDLPAFNEAMVMLFAQRGEAVAA